MPLCEWSRDHGYESLHSYCLATLYLLSQVGHSVWSTTNIRGTSVVVHWKLSAHAVVFMPSLALAYYHTFKPCCCTHARRWRSHEFRNNTSQPRCMAARPVPRPLARSNTTQHTSGARQRPAGVEAARQHRQARGLGGPVPWQPGLGRRDTAGVCWGQRQDRQLSRGDTEARGEATGALLRRVGCRKYADDPARVCRVKGKHSP